MNDSRIVVVDEQSWIASGSVSWEELADLLGPKYRLGATWDGIMCIYTNRVEWIAGPEVSAIDYRHLLETRTYDAGGEVRAVRDSLNSDFAWRAVLDGREIGDGHVCDAHFDELQYLDIDSTRSSGCNYVTTGGGSYTLPLEGAERIAIRNYVKYGDEDGLARIVDFRILGLLKVGESDV